MICIKMQPTNEQCHLHHVVIIKADASPWTNNICATCVLRKKLLQEYYILHVLTSLIRKPSVQTLTYSKISENRP